jgi:hypothetical protein
MHTLSEAMLDQMRLRGQSPRTQQSYLHTVSILSRHQYRSPDRLSQDDLQNWILSLVKERQLSPVTCPGAGYRLPCHLHASGQEGGLFAKDSRHWCGNLDPAVWSAQRLYALRVPGALNPNVYSHMLFLDVEGFTYFFFRQGAHVNKIPCRFNSRNNVGA